VIASRRGTLIVAVLTDEGLLVAADSRYSLLAPGAGSEVQRKIRLIDRPPRTVLCIAGVDRIVRVPGVVREGWTPGPGDILLDFTEIAASRLPDSVEALTEDWLQRTALACANRLNEDRRLQRPPASPSPDRPFTELLFATAEPNGRAARLAVAGLYAGGPGAGVSRASADILELTRVGEPRIFGDLPFLEREAPEDCLRCLEALSAAPLPAAIALASVISLIEAASARPGSTIGGPVDAVLIASHVKRVASAEATGRETIG
jgi:hypothetical protein